MKTKEEGGKIDFQRIKQVEENEIERKKEKERKLERGKKRKHKEYK